MQELIHAFLNVDVIWRYLPDLLSGLLITLELSISVVTTGLVCGILLAMLRSNGWKLANFAIVLFADVMRALPPLMIIVIGFFGLPYLGIRMNGFVVAWASLSMVLAAFVEELVWAGMSALPKGQEEAARSTGLGRVQTLVYVVIPQALRMVIAPLTSRVIATIKNTSLASVVAVPDLLAEASAALGFSSNASPLMAAAVGYLIVLFPLVVFSRRLEAKFSVGR